MRHAAQQHVWALVACIEMMARLKAASIEVGSQGRLRVTRTQTFILTFTLTSTLAPTLALTLTPSLSLILTPTLALTLAPSPTRWVARTGGSGARLAARACSTGAPRRA